MIALFVLKLSAGIMLMWWLMPRGEVTDGFFRIQMRLVLGLAVLAALLLSAGGTWSASPKHSDGSLKPSEPILNAGTTASQSHRTQGRPAMIEAETTARQLRLIAIGVAAVSYAGSIFWALGRRLPGNLCIHLLTVASVTAVGLHSFQVPNHGSLPLQLLSDFSSSAVLGSVITGMLLGHWYLTTPTMSIRPLSWFVRAIAVAAALRLIASGWSLIQFGMIGGDVTRGIWLTTRWVGGIAVPLTVAVVVWRILKYRNTQSATGVLFAGLILVFMGEMAAALLERDALSPY